MRSSTPPLIAIVMVLIAGAFLFGIEVGQGRLPEVEKVMGLVNKGGDALTATVAAEPVDFMPYWRVWNTLERKFIPFGTTTATEVNTQERIYESIEGLVASYHDPYTVFMRPKQSEEFKIATKGSLEGIGSVIGERDGQLTVVQPLPNSPAEKAGLVAGDLITAVDGETTDGVDVEEAVNRIRGEGGTEVVLTIVSEGQDPRDVAITRGTIEIPSTAHQVVAREVPKVAVKDKDEPKATPSEKDTPAETDEEPVETEVKEFYVLRLFSFSQSSINAFERELRAFVESGNDSLMIDLRGNPGGYLDAAVNIAGWFLPNKTVAVREYRGPDMQEIVHYTSGRSLFGEHVPKIAILVDKGSASAAEILAGALQEHGVATVVGTRTFGKGSVQELIDITDQLSLKVTIARWYTPNGLSISQGGLVPDVLIDPSTATSSDPWIDAAARELAI